MPSRLADYLNAARRAHFVGRDSERNFFRSAIQAESPPFFVLHMYGPGGIGKSTLLREFGRMAEEAGWAVIYFDARNIEPLPETFRATLARYLDAPAGGIEEFMAASPKRQLLMVDTYETLAPLDDWLRDHFLPQLPENVMVILSGRNPLSPAWRADAGWQTVLETLPLRNLAPDETREYLSRRNIPESQQQAVMTFTHGHPLALSLIAETFAQREGAEFQFEEKSDDAFRRDIIQTLVKNFLQKVPGPAHRAALEACALVRVTTEPVLCEMLANSEINDLFEWLNELSFIEPRPGGLFPHDLARDALVADLRWRNPDWYIELHRRARHYYTYRISVTTGLEQQRALFDLVFLHRDNPVMRPFIEWQMGGSSLPDRLRDSDIPHLLEMVTRHEGADSARIAAFWLGKQPENVLVPRTAEGLPAGFLLTLDLTAATAQDRATDPAAQAAWNSLKPLRSGERATMFRFWMDGEAYQSVSATQSVIFIHIARHYLTTQGLAYTFFPCADEAFWTPLCMYINLSRMPQADFSVDGRPFAVFGHDWRAEPPAQWLGLLAEREVATSSQTATPPKPGMPALVVLSEPDFAAAVRDALRDHKRAGALTGNPLLNSRLVTQKAGTNASETQRMSTLQKLIEDAAESLKVTPKENRYYRALYHTYFQPAANQEQAAELLDLPFSTYRRHLVRGIERLTEVLWGWEVG
ncbi:MAG: ATP-binding protein [Anaerolineales bacterium]|nr:ATP-binding protein [Anaerolineales bacterium]